MTLAATVATGKVGDGISGGDPGVFMHGPTFMANPLACSVAVASVNLLLGSDWQSRIAAIQSQLERELAPCRDMAHVKEVRVLGAIGVVELHRPVDMARIQEAFVRRGVWVRPFGRLVYLMPPFCITKADLAILTSAMVDVIDGEKQG